MSLPRTLLAILVITSLTTVAQYTIAQDRWTEFRGANGNGVANDQSVPSVFGESQGVTWKTELPGRGWSSPVVADGVVWMTTAIEKIPTEEERVAMLRDGGIPENKYRQLAIASSITLQLLAVDLKSGSLIQSIELAPEIRPEAIHSVNSYASPTPVIDGDKI